jgi:hypothetical protein
MVARWITGLSRLSWAILLLALLFQGVACVGIEESDRLLKLAQQPDEPLKLTDAEQMIDELDRHLTEYGTISVKTPDVWGQDRLAKFRSEYEAQMAEWLKHGFKADINAAVRRNESESTQVQVGAIAGTQPSKAGAAQDDSANVTATSKWLAGMGSAAPPIAVPTEKTPLALEPTLVLDEHSNYLNHLNQLRRINAGDELADRPGYGLYLIRIPVTLSPGPRSRRGKGAIITVSAKPVMTKHTLSNALRNTVINETVDNLAQAIRRHSSSDNDRSSGSAHGTFSLVSYADAELFYGRPNIELLKAEAELELAKDLDNEPHHRGARIEGWLREELESFYHLLQKSATPDRSGSVISAIDPLEELGEQVSRREFSRIAQIHKNNRVDSELRQVSMKTGGPVDKLESQRNRVVEVLAFAMQIQAASINRRLKQDMTDQDPTLNPESLKALSFFEPVVSDEAFHAFESYVNAKWPLRVYAIEPVIAQQNVADAFGRSKRSAFDLVSLVPFGPWRVMAGMAADRRAADDETAIRLNPTMVGFGAGQSTFGWVFYPRLQTGRSSKGRLITDLALLLNGRVVDPTGNDQSIEPGQRECTALVEMPNFIPKIEFITVANWFRTSEAGDGQKSDLEKATILGRKLVAAENALTRAKVEGQYRPEEYDIAMDRIKQLRDMMPTQRLKVRVPFSGDHNDSRIFCSQGLQLRPTLMGWHGKPPERGEESTLFIEGKNFSVHDTHVIAGGKLAKSVLVSRNLLEITIAKDATPTPSGNGDPLLDVNVATPNGASNHLLIKMAAPHGDAVPPPPKPEPPKTEKLIIPSHHRTAGSDRSAVESR